MSQLEQPLDLLDSEEVVVLKYRWHVLSEALLRCGKDPLELLNGQGLALLTLQLLALLHPLHNV